jgi:hypothetical protein
MKFITRRPSLFPARTQRFVRWSRYLLFITGIVALAYVGQEFGEAFGMGTVQF